MSYYNTTIRMVIMLVIVRLTSAVDKDDEKESLKQKLLVSNHESSSAETEDIEFSKLNLKKEFNYGSSSKELSDNDTTLSKHELIVHINNVQALTRGIFASPQIDISEFDLIYTVRDVLSKVIRELDCNYMYDMLVFLSLMTPENYTNEELYKKVDHVCSNWAQHMLNARINSGFPSGEFPYFSWMYYFYMKKMKMFASCCAKHKMNCLHKHMMATFKWEMSKCNTYKDYKFNHYIAEMDRLNGNLALEKTIEACTHLRMMSESKPNLNHDLDTTLYINNVVEDTVIMNTLVKSFGGLNEGDKVIKILYDTMHRAKNSLSSLSKSDCLLHDVLDYFMRMVKTIMLQICLVLLKNLRSLGNSQTAEQVETLLYKQHLNDFVNLFKLNKKDDFMKLITDISPSSKTIGGKIKEITRLLKKYDTVKDGVTFKAGIPRIQSTVNCHTPTLVNIANGIGYKIDVRSSIRESYLCAEVFVEYLKKILIGVNFNILESFLEYSRYKRNVFKFDLLS